MVLFNYRCVYKICSPQANNGNQQFDTSFDNRMKFEDTYRSYSPSFTYILFITRTFSLSFIFGISVIVHDIIDINSLYYFTNWNTILISFYFLFAMICSINGLIYDDPSNILVQQTARDETNLINQTSKIIWSPEISFFSRILLGLFSICGGSAILVTVIAFTILDPSFTFWNVSVHFVTLIALLVEMSLNKLIVRFDHYPFNITWAYLYLIFVWVLVFMGVGDWPYFFLQTDSTSSYSSYSGLVFVNLLFYSIWFGLSELKCYTIKSVQLFCLRNKSQYVTETRKKNNAYVSVFNSEEGNPIIDDSSGVFF